MLRRCFAIAVLLLLASGCIRSTQETPSEIVIPSPLVTPAVEHDSACRSLTVFLRPEEFTTFRSAGREFSVQFDLPTSFRVWYWREYGYTDVLMVGHACMYRHKSLGVPDVFVRLEKYPADYREVASIESLVDGFLKGRELVESPVLNVAGIPMQVYIARAPLNARVVSAVPPAYPLGFLSGEVSGVSREYYEGYAALEDTNGTYIFRLWSSEGFLPGSFETYYHLLRSFRIVE